MTTDTRIGNWLGLDGTGRRFYPLDPRPEEVTIDDIAHALSNICRWGGRPREFYSVAQHSVHVAQIVERARPELAINALLHDAAEAYLGDIPTPLKRGMSLDDGVTKWALWQVEYRCLDAIFNAFGLGDFLEIKVIHDADAIALATEARDLMGGLTWDGVVATSEPTIEPLSPRAARTQFMSMFRRLTTKEKTS